MLKNGEWGRRNGSGHNEQQATIKDGNGQGVIMIIMILLEVTAEQFLLLRVE